MDISMLLRPIITFAIMLYASYLDWRTREIDSRLWKILTASGALLLMLDFVNFRNIRLLLIFTLILAIAVIFSVTLHYLGLMGGGDAKLLIGLGAMYPLLPEGNFIFPAFFLSVFTNSVVTALLLPLYFFLRNISHLPEVRSPGEFIRLFAAYPKDASEIGEFEAEYKLYIKAKDAELGQTEKEGLIWVTPAIPFVIFLTIGLLVSTFYGDLLTLVF